MQKEERIAEVALSGSIRADEDRERAQFESRILEVLESFEVDGLDHDAQLPEGSMATSLAPGFILVIIAKAGKGDRPSRRHPACLEVIAQVLEDDRLVPLFVTPG